jgi:hypothetical protein
MQEQLKFLNLKRGQAPISWETVFEKLDIPDPKKEIEKSFKEEVELQKMKILAQIEIMKVLKSLGIDPSQLGGGDEDSKGGKKGGGGGGGQGGAPHAGGRTASGQNGPRLKQKGAQGGAPRTLVSESG